MNKYLIEDATLVYLQSFDFAMKETGNPQVASGAASSVTMLFMMQEQSQYPAGQLGMILEKIIHERQKAGNPQDNTGDDQ